jgi:hypothetical protein
MSYTPREQLLAPSIEKICDGVDEFSDAAAERMNDHGEWRSSHIVELGEILGQLQAVRARLCVLASQTR